MIYKNFLYIDFYFWLTQPKLKFSAREHFNSRLLFDIVHTGES